MVNTTAPAHLTSTGQAEASTELQSRAMRKAAWRLIPLLALA